MNDSTVIDAAGKKTAAVKNKAGRDYSFDNLRFLLMFLVVAAHLMEITAPFAGSKLLYKVIYSFHMPAFVFLLGYFARFSWKRIVFRWVIPYFVIQTLFTLFRIYALDTDVAIQYITPYWLIWYLLAGAYYHLLLPIYDRKSTGMQILVLLCTVGTALLSGYCDVIGYELSLSRFFVFQPWFVLGFYCRKHSVLERLSFDRMKSSLLGLFSLGLVCLSVWCVVREKTLMRIPDSLLYGSFSYSKMECTVWNRLAVMAMALCWLFFLFVVLRPGLNRRLFLITTIGQHTLPVFLLHGFVVKAMSVYCAGLLTSFWQVLLLTGVLLCLFGNRVCKKITDGICLYWLENRTKSSI